MHYESDDDDSAVLLFFFSVHREFFFNRTNTDGPYIFSSDACLYCGCGRVLRKTWEMLKKMGTEKSRILLRITGGSNKKTKKEGEKRVLVFSFLFF